MQFNYSISLQLFQVQLRLTKETPQMDQSKKIGNKYNKVNQQKKFHLLTLIYKDKISIREAAEIVRINYLTAKTIVFFHKNNYKSYQFDIIGTHQHICRENCKTASYVHVRRLSNITDKLIKPKSRIQVICSIGNILSPAVTGTTEENFPRQPCIMNECSKVGIFPFSSNIKNHEAPENKLSGWTNPYSPTVAGQSHNQVQVAAMNIYGNERIGENMPSKYQAHSI